ncbi:MAG: transposase [Xanthomonadaceae bacterium]|jgi:transposase|nr:transposase [Xanthomonadaceae bacterium]
MTKYSSSLKREVVELYLQSRSGHRSIATQYGLDYAEARHWIALYRQHGEASLERSFHRRYYSAERKPQILQHMWREELSIVDRC